MEILFVKLPGNRYEVVVRGRRGPDLRLPAREIGPTIPHDLAHAAIERALGIDDGFWSAIERGVTFAGFEPVTRPHEPVGNVTGLRRYGAACTWAALAVSWAHRAWSGQRTIDCGSYRPPLDERQLARAYSALDAARACWAALKDGETLCWIW